MMRTSRALFVFLFAVLAVATNSAQQAEPVQIASLRPTPGLHWQRTSPARQQSDGPVLYQLVFTPGTTGTLAKFDTNTRHLTNSDITDNGGIVAIGASGFRINAGTGVVNFVNTQTFPGTVTGVAAGDSSITIGGTASVPTVKINAASAFNGQVLTANGAGGVSFQNSYVFSQGIQVDVSGQDDGSFGPSACGGCFSTDGYNLILFGGGPSASGEGIGSQRTPSNAGVNMLGLDFYTGYRPRMQIENGGAVHIYGMLSKGGGSFLIDHPLDPANKYLSHSFVESPDMKNVYDGIVVLNARGQAWVELPDYFEALNMDFRYQLTPIGNPGQHVLYIAKEIANNRFQIAGGKPGAKVSWQVTGIRHDAFANAHRVQVEEDKGEKRGTYLHPELFEKRETAAGGR